MDGLGTRVDLTFELAQATLRTSTIVLYLLRPCSFTRFSGSLPLFHQGKLIPLANENEIAYLVAVNLITTPAAARSSLCLPRVTTSTTLYHRPHTSHHVYARYRLPA